VALGKNGLSGKTTQTPKNSVLSQMADVRTNPQHSIIPCAWQKKDAIKNLFFQ
jgi:hypothetical protein